MTDEDREIERLMTVPPRIVLTKKERRQRAVMRVFGVISIGSFLLAGSALVVDASSSCVNSGLSARNAPSSNDAKAHIKFAEDLLAALTHAAGASPAEVRATLSKQTQKYVDTLKADQDFRNAHPLGHC